MQPKVAKGLISSLKPWKAAIPPGAILEFGCGTGMLTELLIQEFPDREIFVTDASPQMLEVCKKNIERSELLTNNVHFDILDVNDFTPGERKYGLVIGNFVAHWFKDTSIGLQNLSEELKHGGIILTSFPGNHSFPNWYEYCLELGLPHTANPLPDVEEVLVKLSMNDVQIDYYENDLYQEFEQPIDFFRHLKRIGSHTSKLDKSLSYKQFRMLVNHWKRNSKGVTKIKWHVVYLAGKKG
ncbi:methyltransferase [Gracilimonas sp.]|uniref:methyltransferase n=1 Tax=Gracilimonas sp. TaxID=1974203 RepID=UPI002872046C|nr:methyltransferase [Gracilimonas sp.]